MVAGSYERVYGIIRQIPAGRVATYGQIASLAGLGGHARLVGYALSALPDDETIPWHRVINAHGEVSERSDRFSERVQRDLLVSEGVLTGSDGRVDLSRFRWRPASATDVGAPAKAGAPVSGGPQ